jgi:hypothetical protein
MRVGCHRRRFYSFLPSGVVNPDDRRKEWRNGFGKFGDGGQATSQMAGWAGHLGNVGSGHGQVHRSLLAVAENLSPEAI